MRAETEIVRDALLVPQRAVTELQGASQLRVVGADGKVSVRTVTLGDRVGGRWIVTEGLEAGRRVVVDAPQLRDGQTVKTRPYVDATEPNAQGTPGVQNGR